MDNPSDILLLLVYGAIKSKDSDFARPKDFFKKSVVVLLLIIYTNIGNTEWIL